MSTTSSADRGKAASLTIRTKPTTTTTTESRLRTGNDSRSRPRTAATSSAFVDNEVICAITESRGISPTVGLSFVNLSTSEAVLCQFPDTQTYARTCHKLTVFNPSIILYASNTHDSKLVSIVAENFDVSKNDTEITEMDRRYWSEDTGHEYLQRLAFPDDLETLRISMGGNFFASCCFGAVGSDKLSCHHADAFRPQNIATWNSDVHLYHNHYESGSRRPRDQ